jgi:hypothetical protein
MKTHDNYPHWIAPSGLGILCDPDTQGVALGYLMLPRWGTNRSPQRGIRR